MTWVCTREHARSTTMTKSTTDELVRPFATVASDRDVVEPLITERVTVPAALNHEAAHLSLAIFARSFTSDSMTSAAICLQRAIRPALSSPCNAKNRSRMTSREL